MATLPIYEKDFTTSLCYVDTVQLSEYDNYVNDTNYIYSGITLILGLSGFTSHFDIPDHLYSNFILNNDVYTYTGLTNETHYFIIDSFYSGATHSIDPLLTGLTEENVISGFTTTLISCSDILDGLTGTCCPTQAVLNNLPWVVITNEGGGIDNCSNYIARRNEKGWTLDFVFNRNGLPWTDSVFFFTGVRDEYDPENYADNNLSFKFTDDGRIKWSSYRYSGYCDTVSGYTPVYYISTGQTMPLCTGGTSDDFNITIIFERHNYYTDCDLANEGGWNDLIYTGLTSTTGSTIVTGETAEQLNVNWLDERSKRLGTLKIYHNGRPLEIDDVHSSIPNFRNAPVYKFENWEEIILSDRGFQPFTHVVGGGVTGSEGMHEGVCCYTIKYAAYFEDIFNFVDLFDRYTNTTKPSYSIIECNEACVDDILMGTPTPTPTIPASPSVTPTITRTETPTPSVTPSLTPSLTPSQSLSRTVTPSKSLSRTPSLTPTNTKTPTQSITTTRTVTPTPSMTRTVSVTPTISRSVRPTHTATKTLTPTLTPTRTITPTPSCSRPTNLLPYYFYHSYDKPPMTNFTSSLVEACDARYAIGFTTFIGISGFTEGLYSGNPVFTTGTTCTLLPTGYYVLGDLDPTIVYINNGYIAPVDPCSDPTPTLTITTTPTPTPSVTPVLFEAFDALLTEDYVYYLLTEDGIYYIKEGI